MTDLQKFPLRYLKYAYQLTAAFTAFRLHRTHHFDGIWAMMAHATAIPAGIFKFFHPQVPYLLTLQEGDPPEYIEKLAKPVWPLFKRGFVSADYLQGISSFLVAWGRRMGFMGEAVLIPNGADTARFAAATNDRMRVRNELGLGEELILLVSTSRLVHKNALDDVIRALSLLPTNVHFVNFGFGPDKKDLDELASRLGVKDRTHLLDHPGVPQLPRYLQACDIFIRPSRSEGMGISFIEAMAAGLPVIATQEGGIADFLFDEKRNPDKETTGWAVDKNSPDQISEAVQSILAHREQVARVTRTASGMVTKKYDWNLIAAAMRRLFDRMFESR